VCSTVGAVFGPRSGCSLLVALHVVYEPERGPDEEQESAHQHDRGAGVEGAVVDGHQHHQRTRRRRSEYEPLPHAVSFLVRIADAPSILPLDESRMRTLIGTLTEFADLQCPFCRQYTETALPTLVHATYGPAR
jgi:hypothetical protein